MLRLLSFVLILILGVIIFIEQTPNLNTFTYEAVEGFSTKSSEDIDFLVSADPTSSIEVKEIEDERPLVQHVPLPEEVKAIYMSACVAGTPSFRNDLVNLVNKTELNSIMIDIKDYSGTISFPVTEGFWQPAWQAAGCGARDMEDFIAYLHEQDIFVIGRITVFQDKFLAPRKPEWAVLQHDGSVWKDFKGIGFIDVAAQEYWDHIVDLSIMSYNLGFDELNYDYIRYPSDGNMRAAVYPHTASSEWPNDRPANLEAFFVYLHEAMTDPDNFAVVRHENTGREVAVPYTSADTFGMTTTNYDDLSIGQIQERTAPYFDFVAPMVYPSHYPNGWRGFSNPNHYPYEVVYHAMSDGVARMQASTTRLVGFQHERIGTSTLAIYSKPVFGADRLRTWIQDFNYGGIYGPEEVRAQIQASYDAGVKSWMLWAPSNRYTKEALVPFYRGDHGDR